ncbi:MAG: citrate synthase [Haloarcula sp.]
MPEQIQKGLEDVVVAESTRSYIDGTAGELVYSGYTIEDLATEASFEEVLYLLWHGSLPNEAELAEFEESMATKRALDDAVLDLMESLAAADADPMAALRTGVSMLSSFSSADADRPTESPESTLAVGRELTAKLPTLLGAFARFRRGVDPIAPRRDLSHAANFLYMLNGEEPDPVLAETFDMALILHMDHGLNASTFAGMVTASTLSDPVSAITSAIGTLSGPLHGGANQNVMQMLEEIDESDLEAVPWVVDALDEDRRIPGFGHRVYDVKDPRARILGEKSADLGAVAGEQKWYRMSSAIEEYMATEHGIAPNVDFYSASTYYQMGIPVDLYTPIFAMSRIGGWVAHVLEQYDDNRLIRPRARYVGRETSETSFVPLEER